MFWYLTVSVILTETVPALILFNKMFCYFGLQNLIVKIVTLNYYTYFYKKGVMRSVWINRYLKVLINAVIYSA
jgi:hypothetical protein